MKNALSNLESTKTELNQIREELLEKSKNALMKFFEELFNDYPFIKTVKWTQYSPYFNDGDECEFSLHCMLFCGDDHDDVSYWGDVDTDYKDFYYCDGDFADDFFNENENEIDKFVLRNELIAIEKILFSREFEDIFESTFGNHVEVIATKNGFEVREYDHD